MEILGFDASDLKELSYEQFKVSIWADELPAPVPKIEGQELKTHEEKTDYISQYGVAPTERGSGEKLANNWQKASVYIFGFIKHIKTVRFVYKPIDTSSVGAPPPTEEKGTYDFDEKADLFGFLRSKFGRKLLEVYPGDKNEIKQFLANFGKQQGSKKGKEWKTNHLNFYLATANKVLRLAKQQIADFEEENEPSLTEAETPIYEIKKYYKMLNAFMITATKITDLNAPEEGLNDWWAKNIETVKATLEAAFVEVGYAEEADSEEKRGGLSGQDKIVKFINDNSSIDRFFAVFKTINNKMADIIQGGAGADDRPQPNDPIEVPGEHEKLYKEVLQKAEELAIKPPETKIEERWKKVVEQFKDKLKEMKVEADKSGNQLIRRVVEEETKTLSEIDVAGTDIKDMEGVDAILKEKDPLLRFLNLFKFVNGKADEHEGTYEVKLEKLKRKIQLVIKKLTQQIRIFYKGTPASPRQVNWNILSDPNNVAKFKSIADRYELNEDSKNPDELLKEFIKFLKEKEKELSTNSNNYKSFDSLIRLFGGELLEPKDNDPENYDLALPQFKAQFNKVVVQRFKELVALKDPAADFRLKKEKVKGILDAMIRWRESDKQNVGAPRGEPVDPRIMDMLGKEVGNLTEDTGEEKEKFFQFVGEIKAKLDSEEEPIDNYEKLFRIIDEEPPATGDIDDPKYLYAIFKKEFNDKVVKRFKKIVAEKPSEEDTQTPEEEAEPEETLGNIPEDKREHFEKLKHYAENPGLYEKPVGQKHFMPRFVKRYVETIEPKLRKGERLTQRENRWWIQTSQSNKLPKKKPPTAEHKLHELLIPLIKKRLTGA